MFTKRELGIIALLSAIITWILYSYKPRNYTASKLVINSVANFSLWLLIVGVIYIVAKLMFIYGKKLFYKKLHN